MRPKISRRKGIMKIRSEINEVENKCTLGKPTKPKTESL